LYIFSALDRHQVDESKNPEFRFKNQDLLPWEADPGNGRWVVPELFYFHCAQYLSAFSADGLSAMLLRGSSRDCIDHFLNVMCRALQRSQAFHKNQITE